MTPQSFTRVARVALAALCAIVVTGALVRLTGSGLGCADWPRCSEAKFVDVSSGHTAIEQINRLFTGVVSLSVVVAVLGAHRLRPRRRSLIIWAWLLVAGVLAQIVLGGIVVLTGLHPLANMGHFLLSMLLVMAAVVLVRRSRQSEHQRWWRSAEQLPQRVSPALVLTVVLGALATVVAGTVVTASGPHAGDEEAPRFGFTLTSVTRVHTGAMFLTILALVVVWHRTRTSGPGPRRDSMLSALRSVAAVVAVQATIGYWQYFSGVPAALVALHILGATMFWMSVVDLWCAPPLHDVPATSDAERAAVGEVRYGRADVD